MTRAMRPMTLADYDQVLALWLATPGVSVRDADSRESTERYLLRNPGLSFVAENAGEIVGCLMAGHDGRRGYLQHLAVHPEHRRQGLASALIAQALAALAQLGIQKSHVDVLRSNALGQAFWESQGWQLRDDLYRYSFIRNANANA